jgi:hypothetical protein
MVEDQHITRSLCSVHRRTQMRKIQIYMHALSKIQTYDPSVQTVQNSTCHAPSVIDLKIEQLKIV